ncbi:MAG: VWA domain-containing protein [Natronospirillum sp.]
MTELHAQTKMLESEPAEWRVRGRLLVKKARLAVGVALALLLAGCGEPVNHSRAAYLLLDISEDYVHELNQAQALTRYLLADMTSGDTLGALFIDNSSYTNRNVIAQTTFDHRPSVTHHQKRGFLAQVDAFVGGIEVPSAHNDITGGILLAQERLIDVDARQRTLYLFSDLQEDRAPWLDRDFPIDLEGIEVVALNVTKLDSDNSNPRAYGARLAQWQAWVEESGGNWRVINDMGQLGHQVALQ